jgi:hypothetical protein
MTCNALQSLNHEDSSSFVRLIDPLHVSCFVILRWAALTAVAKLHDSRSHQNRTADPRRVKTDQNSQRSKANNAVLLTYSRARWWVRSFRGPEACNLVKASAIISFTYRNFARSPHQYFCGTQVCHTEHKNGNFQIGLLLSRSLNGFSSQSLPRILKPCVLRFQTHSHWDRLILYKPT